MYKLFISYLVILINFFDILFLFMKKIDRLIILIIEKE